VTKTPITINPLDPSQKSALQSILNDDDELFLVYGPPGTGKSQLVVSMLYQLAVANKRTLFVSQNIEALQVIDRMIKRAEKEMGYPIDGHHLSIQDFCLMLYKAEHRYAKYTKTQLARLNDKPTRTTYLPTSGNMKPYPLTYNLLEREMNNASAPEDVGFDELLKYYLRYVKAPLMPEPLKEFSKIDVRAVMKEIEGYHNVELFNQLVQAQNELRYIKIGNDDSPSLPAIREGIASIRELLPSDEYVARAQQPVTEYLEAIVKYLGVSRVVDLYRISTDNFSIADLTKELHEIEKRSSVLISAQDVLKGIAENDELIVLAPQLQQAFEQDAKATEQILSNCLSVVEQLHGAIKNVEVANLIDLQTVYAQNLTTEIVDNLEINPNLITLSIEEIKELEIAGKHYNEAGKLKKLFRSIPELFKTKLAVTDVSEIDWYMRVFDSLHKYAPLMDENGLGTLVKMSKRKLTSNISVLRPAQGKTTNEIIVLEASLTSMLKQVQDYGYGGSNTYGQLSAWLQNAHRASKLYNHVLENNLNVAVNVRGAELVAKINATIRHMSARTLIAVEYEKIRHYFIANTPIDEVIGGAKGIIERLLALQDDVDYLLNRIEIPSVARGDIEKYSSILKAIKTLEERDIYSDNFFVIEKTKTLVKWYESLAGIEYYNNLEMYNAYRRHVQSINTIKKYLGENSLWIDAIVSNEDISFDGFAERIVNTLVHLSFQQAPIELQQKVKIGFFDDYRKALTEMRRYYYVQGLEQLASRTKESARYLSNSNNWKPGSSVMDRLRNNTKQISAVFPIIIATPKEVAKYLAADKQSFDYVVFDEASQLLPGQALPSIYRAKKAVIIGDPHQMPPMLGTANSVFSSNTDSEEDEDAGESILDLIRKQPQQQHHLKVHYRSESSKLFEPSRRAIYREDGINPIWEAQLSGSAPIDIVDSLGNDVDSFGYDMNFSRICDSILEYLDKDPNADMCVLFTTKLSQSRFSDYLAEVASNKYPDVIKLDEDSKLLISTVTNCQGIEGKYSILYLQHYERPGMMWFFKEGAGAYKRLNVAITRQRSGLKLLLADSRAKWLITCEEKLSNSNTGPNTAKSAELLQSLLQNAGEVMDSAYLDRTLVPNGIINFDSPLTEQLYSRLTSHYEDNPDLKFYCEVGWHLRIPDAGAQRQHRMNVGFRIDIGAYSTSRRKFILGIEMDGAAYHSGFDKEHSDYTRQQVLESKGWEIYRIWSSNWLNDTERELGRLIEVIDSRLI